EIFRQMAILLKDNFLGLYVSWPDYEFENTKFQLNKTNLWEASGRHVRADFKADKTHLPQKRLSDDREPHGHPATVAKYSLECPKERFVSQRSNKAAGLQAKAPGQNYA